MASISVASVRGIPIKLHWSFLLLLPFFAYLMGRAYFSPQDGALPDTEGWIWGSLLAIGLFASVLVHELAHSLMALRENVKVKDITLLPIGGVSAFEELPRDARAEFKITLVGPLTNFAIGLPLLALVRFVPAPEWGAGLWLFVFWLGLLNVILGGFNLFVPAFPMDGGRILRALLTAPMGRVQATRVAASVGRVFAVAMGLWGFLTFGGGGWLLLLIAFFIYMGANAEEQGVRMTQALEPFSVGDLMTPHVDTLARHESVEDAFARMQATRHVVLPVLDSGALDGDGEHPRVLGVVHLEDLKKVSPLERGMPVETIARRDFPTLAATARATDVVKVLARASAEGALPAVVLDDAGGLVGIVTQTDVARFVEIANARGNEYPGGQGTTGGGFAG